LHWSFLLFDRFTNLVGQLRLNPLSRHLPPLLARRLSAARQKDRLLITEFQVLALFASYLCRGWAEMTAAGSSEKLA
jgi:hypothetical protein